MGKNVKKLAATTLFAAIAGFITGLLTAPKSGKETRQDIKNTANKAKTEAERNLKNLHSELSQLVNQGQAKAKSLKSKTREELQAAVEKGSVAKDKAREMLSALHDGEAEDKDLQKAVTESKKAINHLKKFIKTSPKNGPGKSKK